MGEEKGVETEGNKVFFCGGGKLIFYCSSRLRREQMQCVTDTMRREDGGWGTMKRAASFLEGVMEEKILRPFWP